MVWYSGMPDATLTRPEVTLFEDSPVLTPAIAQARTEAWRRWEAVSSTPVQVGAIALGAEHEAVLASFDKPYRCILMDRIDDFNLTPTQRELCRVTREAFREIVSWDAHRGGYRPYSPSVSAGRFYRKLRSDWHPDRGQLSWLDKPTVRYVASFGNGATLFAVGGADRTMISSQGKLRPNIKVGGEGGQLQPVSHPLGVVTRFMSHFDIHSEPFRKPDEPRGAKPRLFLSASAPLLPDDYDY